jgi:ABC-2 type transport system ATP-binding protein
VSPEAGPGPRPPAIELRGVGKRYGETLALEDVSLSVGWGEVFGYVGPNGAGKTTTIKVLTGLVRPDSGWAAIAGFGLDEAPLDAKARLGYVPESGALYEKFSAEEYLRLVGRLRNLDGADLEERVDQWLRSFGLDARRSEVMGTLSKGTRQRVCWAAALLHDPEVLVLDEPLNGLDVETVAHVRELMAGRAARGRTVFYSSHLIDVVCRVCTRVAVLHRGRVLASGAVDQVAAALGAPSLEEALLDLGRQAGGVEEGA